MVAPRSLTPSVPLGPGPVNLLNAARAPFRVHPPYPLHGHVRILVQSHASREFSSDQRSVGEPAPLNPNSSRGCKNVCLIIVTLFLSKNKFKSNLEDFETILKKTVEVRFNHILDT